MNAHRQEVFGNIARERRMDRQRVVAATRIQTWVRMWEARDIYQHKIRWAIRMIQAFQKLIAARSAFIKVKNAVKRIQCAVRTFHTPHMKGLHSAARLIQRAYLHYRVRSSLECTDFLVYMRAAAKIQAAWRSRVESK